MFLAPEVCMGSKYDGQCADVYALGVCLYMFIYGQPPFKVWGDLVGGVLIVFVTAWVWVSSCVSTAGVLLFNHANTTHVHNDSTPTQ